MTEKFKNMTFIGAGKMAEAMLQGILHAKIFKPQQITLTDVSAERLAYLSGQYGVKTSINNTSAVAGADIIVLAVKPQVLATVLTELHTAVKNSQLLVSIVAGATIRKLDPEHKLKIARVMPNTPAIVGQAASALSFNGNVLPDEKEFVVKLFKVVGLVVEVEEDLINAVTGLSGSGPAFVFRLMEAFIEAGKSLGLTENTARTLTFQTFKGSAELAEKSGKSLSELIEQVTSPNGTTAAGRQILDSSDVKAVLVKTIVRAKQRAEELNQGKG